MKKIVEKYFILYYDEIKLRRINLTLTTRKSATDMQKRPMRVCIMCRVYCAVCSVSHKHLCLCVDAYVIYYECPITRICMLWGFCVSILYLTDISR